MTAAVTSAPKEIGKHLKTTPSDYLERPTPGKAVNPQQKKENKVINIILTSVILVLALSITGYLFSLRFWKSDSIGDSAPTNEEALSVDTLAEESDPPAKAMSLVNNQAGTSVTPVEQALSNYPYHDVIKEYVTFRPYVMETNPEVVFNAYKTDADNGDAEAQFFVFLFELLGIGNKPSDQNEIWAYLRASAENGFAPAQFELGLLNAMNGSYADAAVWYEKAADQGFSIAQNNLGNLYRNGRGVPVDHQKAFNLFTVAAEKGIDQAQENLALCYEDGEGVEQNYAVAAQWHQRAADQGLPFAQYNLGLLYLNGKGVEQNINRAIELITLAAEQGDADAQTELGVFYANGEGMVQNYVEANKWFRKAADQGHGYAAYCLGISYVSGYGVLQDFAKAFEYFSAAAEQGIAQAQYMLGIMYETGEGLGQNYLTAAEWYQKAAEQGLPEAQAALEALTTGTSTINTIKPRTWKDAYREVINWWASEYQFYYIYDIDKDGMPELILDRGYPEAGRMGALYRFVDGEAVFVDEFSMSHCVLATYPLGNGIVKQWAHMGGWAVDLMTMDYGYLTTTEIIPYSEGFHGTFPMIEGSMQIRPIATTDTDYLMNYPL
jgi:TPR repeat protein